MALFSKAKWRPVKNFTNNGQEKVLGVVVHIMDGTLEGSEAWFNNSSAQASSHFGTGKDGELRQWVDTADRAWAQAAGNRDHLSVENEGHGGDSLTSAQIEANAQVLAWAAKKYGFKLQLATSTSSQGLAYHALGGSAWGGHTSCPGSKIIAQLPAILARAKAINGVTAPPPSPTYAPFPGASFFKFGKVSPIYLAVGKALVKAGYKGYKVGPSTTWGPADERGVKWFQQSRDELKGDADGKFGPLTWKLLRVPKA